MSKFEYVQSVKAEIAFMKAEIEKLEAAEPTAENLKKVNAIAKRAKELKIYLRQYCRKYGMAA